MIKKNKKVMLMVTVPILVFLCLIMGYKTISDKLITAFNEFFMTVYETDEYKEGFVNTTYKNYTISHNKDVESALELIYTYLDDIEAKGNEVLGITSSDKLNIKIDYNKEIFDLRSYNTDSSGYYNVSTKSMYLLSEDVVRDIIMNMVTAEFLNDGSMYVGFGTSFKQVLFHEYTHYLLSSFCSENDIEEIPMWFNEGIAEYMALADKYKGQEIDFVSLTEIENNKQWMQKNNNGNVYIESMYAIYNMINLKGEGCIRDIILKCKEKEFKDSFEEVMGISLNEFDEMLQQKFSGLNVMYDELVDYNWETNKYRLVKEKCLEKYVEEVEDNIRAYELLITMYEKDKGFSETEKLIKLGIEKHPEESIFWRRLGILYEDNNMLDLANECYLNAEKFNTQEERNN